MNNNLRKELQEINNRLKALNSSMTTDEIKEMIEDIPDLLQDYSNEERDKADNMPLNMQFSERYDLFNEAADCLEDAACTLSDIIDSLDDEDFDYKQHSLDIKSAIGNINDAIK